MGLAGGRGCGRPGETPFRLRGSCSRTRWAGARGCRSLRGRPGTRKMDLEASLLAAGPNASNTSNGPDNLTSAGE